MGKNGEPTSLDVEGIISSSNELAAAAERKKIMADPLLKDGIFQKPEPELVNIKQILAAEETRRLASVEERLKTTRENAKKNTTLYMEDVG